MLANIAKRIARHLRIRSRVSGTASKPRLAVFRSNTSIYAQLIDDTTGKTLCAASDLKITTGSKIEKAQTVGAEVAKKSIALGLTECVFDRGGFLYHGRVKALAEAARGAGLKF